MEANVAAVNESLDAQLINELNAVTNTLKEKLGKARAKKGMFEGDMEDGELEIGQIAGLIHEIKPAVEILNEIIDEFNEVKKNI